MFPFAVLSSHHPSSSIPYIAKLLNCLITWIICRVLSSYGIYALKSILYKHYFESHKHHKKWSSQFYYLLFTIYR